MNCALNNTKKWARSRKKGRSFLLTARSLFCLQLVFVAYSNLVWSLYLRLNSVWSSLLTVENWFGRFLLTAPLVRKLGLVFLLTIPHRT